MPKIIIPANLKTKKEKRDFKLDALKRNKELRYLFFMAHNIAKKTGEPVAIEKFFVLGKPCYRPNLRGRRRTTLRTALARNIDLKFISSQKSNSSKYIYGVYKIILCYNCKTKGLNQCTNGGYSISLYEDKRQFQEGRIFTLPLSFLDVNFTFHARPADMLSILTPTNELITGGRIRAGRIRTDQNHNPLVVAEPVRPLTVQTGTFVADPHPHNRFAVEQMLREQLRPATANEPPMGPDDDPPDDEIV